MNKIAGFFTKGGWRYGLLASIVGASTWLVYRILNFMARYMASYYHEALQKPEVYDRWLSFDRLATFVVLIAVIILAIRMWLSGHKKDEEMDTLAGQLEALRRTVAGQQLKGSKKANGSQKTMLVVLTSPVAGGSDNLLYQIKRRLSRIQQITPLVATTLSHVFFNQPVPKRVDPDKNSDLMNGFATEFKSEMERLKSEGAGELYIYVHGPLAQRPFLNQISGWAVVSNLRVHILVRDWEEGSELKVKALKSYVAGNEEKPPVLTRASK